MINIIEHLTEADTSEKLKDLYKIVGKEKFIKLLDKRGGAHLYLPQKENFELRIISRLIYEEYLAGVRTTALADKYSLDVRTVRKYIKQHKARNKTT